MAKKPHDTHCFLFCVVRSTDMNLMKNIKPDNKRCVLVQIFDGENLFGVVKEDYIEIREPLIGFRGTLIGFERIRKWVYEKEVNIFMD